jgi:hypothetical protein
MPLRPTCAEALTNDRSVPGRKEGGVRADERALGRYIAELAVDHHTVPLKFAKTSKRGQTAVVLIGY